ncbi:MAG: hypothetical protein ABI776_01920 [Nocardioidaceae bacterium]
MSSPRSARDDRDRPDDHRDATYARRWSALWSVAVAVGIGIGSLEWSPLTVVLLVAMNSVCAAVVMLLLHPAEGQRSRPVRRPRRPGPLSLTIGAGLAALSAVATASPPLALLVLLVAVLTSPVAVRLARRLLLPDGQVRPPGPSRIPEPSPSESLQPTMPLASDPGALADPADLSDHDLFRLWRRTFWDLLLEGERVPSWEMVELRARCLEELERRNPDAVRAWLESGARASGGPEKFWRTGQRPDDASAAS